MNLYKEDLSRWKRADTAAGVKIGGLTKLRFIHTDKGWTFGRERLGSPVKPPQGAYFSRVGTERCGNGRDFFLEDSVRCGIRR